MTKLLFVWVLLLSGCSESLDQSPVLWDSQHMRCDRFFDLNDNEMSTLETPVEFSVSPTQAMLLAESKAGFKCGHKFGAQIYVDKKNYYLLRLSGEPRLNVQQRIRAIEVIIDGTSGDVWQVKKHI